MKVVSIEAAIQPQKIKLEIWDTPTSANFGPLVKSYYNSMQGALVVYDPSHPLTLEVAQKLIEDLPASTKNLLVANKSDLCLGANSAVSPGVLLTSAKTGENVTEMILQLQRLISCS